MITSAKGFGSTESVNPPPSSLSSHGSHIKLLVNVGIIVVEKNTRNTIKRRTNNFLMYHHLLMF